MNCPECQEWLERRLDGDSSTEAAELERHMADCAVCRQQHMAGLRLLEGLQNLRPPEPADSLSPRIVGAVLADMRFRRLRFRIAAGVALAASLLVAVLGGYLRLPLSPREPALVKGGKDVREIREKPAAEIAAAPSLTESVEEAGSAVVSFTERLAHSGKQQAKIWWSASALDISQALPDVKKLEAPLDPAAESLRQTGQGMSESLQTVAQSARRAVAYFVRELPPLEPKSGS